MDGIFSRRQKATEGSTSVWHPTGTQLLNLGTTELSIQLLAYIDRSQSRYLKLSNRLLRFRDPSPSGCDGWHLHQKATLGSTSVWYPTRTQFLNPGTTELSIQLFGSIDLPASPALQWVSSGSIRPVQSSSLSSFRYQSHTNWATLSNFIIVKLKVFLDIKMFMQFFFWVTQKLLHFNVCWTISSYRQCVFRVGVSEIICLGTKQDN